MSNVTLSELQQALSTRINEAEAELTALENVKINTSHKTLTNKAVENGRIGDYLSIGKALYVSYQSYNRYMTTDITAYSYTDENGNELGTNGCIRISRTITPLELRLTLDSVIEGREKSLDKLKTDLIKSATIIAKYNKIQAQLDELLNGVTWATRGVLK